MGLFRNSEIKRFALFLAAFCSLCIVVGFLIGIYTGLPVLFVCIVLCSGFWVFTRRRYRALAVLSESIDAILHGNDHLGLDGIGEGELSLLQSEIQKMTLRLREQAEGLRRDKAFLADALADLAHQLRTPMTSIRMLAAFLAKPDLDAEKRLEFSRELEGLLRRIDWLLTTLLKISKIDAGTAVFARNPVCVRDLLQTAAEPLLIPMELRGIEFALHCAADISIHCDRNWTAEALGNILKNCVEHSPAGGSIRVDCAQNAIFTEIIIQDSGTGFDSADLPHIFERFYQGRHSKDGNFGVGLALCRMVLTAQGATVKAENRVEGGARFVVRVYGGRGQ